jgi:translation initiation factor 5
MSTVNIGRDQADRSFRYKMPALDVAWVRGSTVVRNLGAVARALRTPPALPTKFFSIELGARAEYKEERQQRRSDGVAVIRGVHGAPALAHLLDTYIREFILCHQCRLPETTLLPGVTTIRMTCAACGASGRLASQHRLVRYMLGPGRSLLE